jgi:hypothetical protein
VLSGRGLCDGLITRPDESYRLGRVVVCDQETSKNEEAKARYRAVENTTTMGCNAKKNKQTDSTENFKGPHYKHRSPFSVDMRLTDQQENEDLSILSSVCVTYAKYA